MVRGRGPEPALPLAREGAEQPRSPASAESSLQTPRKPAFGLDQPCMLRQHLASSKELIQTFGLINLKNL